jgi:hypothetical protein
MPKPRCDLVVVQTRESGESVHVFEDTTRGLGEARWEATKLLKVDRSKVKVDRVCDGKLKERVMTCILFRGRTKCR